MPNMDIIRYFDIHEDELVEDIFAVCRVNSERTAAEEGAPYGAGPRAALQKALEICRKYGFDAEIHGDRVLVAEYGEGEPALGILAHLDVVPAGTGWTKADPYDPVREGDMLYGRGVADDKGPAMASLYALRAVKELGIKLGKKVQLLLGSCEETGSDDIRWYLENRKMPPMVFTPDGDFPVANVEKGRAVVTVTAPACEPPMGMYVVSMQGGTVANAVPGTAEAVVRFVSKETMEAAISYNSFNGALYEFEKLSDLDTRITCNGVAAHASLPEEGENAVTALLSLLMALPLAECAGHDALAALCDAIPYGDLYGETFGGFCEDDVSGKLTVNLGTLSYSVEEGLNAVIDMRVPVCGDSPAIRDRLAEKIGSAAEVTLKGFSKPHIVPSDSKFVKGLMAIYKDYTGLDGEPMSMGGGTYVHNIDGGVAFGCTMPGRRPHMHEPDENMSVSDLKLAGAMFAEAILTFCR